jgi:uncharacterized protein
MGLEENKATAIAFLEIVSGLRSGDANTLTTRNATWWLNGTTSRSGMRSVADVLQAVKTNLLGQAEGPMDGTIGAIVAEGNRVAVETAGRLRLKGGRLYTNQAHILFIFEDGRIASIREYGDTEMIAQLFGTRDQGT